MNKPMNMLLPKRVESRNEKRDAKLRSIKKSELKQLGHFKKNQKQRKKMRMKLKPMELMVEVHSDGKMLGL